MNKEEILRRAQDKKPNKMDEMELDILNKGCRAGVIVGLAACLIVMIAKMIADVPYYDVYAIYCFMTGGLWCYKWLRLKKKSDLFYAILWGGVAMGFLVGYLVEIF